MVVTRFASDTAGRVSSRWILFYPKTLLFLTIRQPGDAGSLKSDWVNRYDFVNLR